MNVIDSLAGKIAVSIKNTNPEKTNSVEVMKFSLIILLNGFITLGSAILIGSLAGNASVTFLAFVAFVVLRICSGGFHFQSSITCTIVSTILLISIPFIPLNYLWLQVLTWISLFLVLVYAPARIQEHSNIAKKYYPILKCIALLIVGSNLIFRSEVIAIAFFVQSLTLIHSKRKEVDI